MIDVEKIRQDFPMIVNHPELIYFDNGATTYKPKAVIDAICNFYCNFTSNVERGDYETAIQADRAYDNTRKIIARFINCEPCEVAFTANITATLNQIAYGLGRYDVSIEPKNKNKRGYILEFKSTDNIDKLEEKLQESTLS